MALRGDTTAKLQKGSLDQKAHIKRRFVEFGKGGGGGDD